MARLAYPNIERPELQPLVAEITAARGSLLHLYRMLLHSPAIAEGWLHLLSAVRNGCSLPGAFRELIIMRVAVLNGAPYEADQHRHIALAEGVSLVQLDALQGWEDSVLFDPKERALLALTDAMTRHVQVADGVFNEARKWFDEAVVVEIVTTIAAYNMVSRVLEALQIHSDDRPSLLHEPGH